MAFIVKSWPSLFSPLTCFSFSLTGFIQGVQKGGRRLRSYSQFNSVLYIFEQVIFIVFLVYGSLYFFEFNMRHLEIIIFFFNLPEFSCSCQCFTFLKIMKVCRVQKSITSNEKSYNLCIGFL